MSDDSSNEKVGNIARGRTLYRFDTEYSADSCEFNHHLNVLATGTYQVYPLKNWKIFLKILKVLYNYNYCIH